MRAYFEVSLASACATCQCSTRAWKAAAAGAGVCGPIPAGLSVDGLRPSSVLVQDPRSQGQPDDADYQLFLASLSAPCPGAGGGGGGAPSAGHRAGVIIGIIVLVAVLLGLLVAAAVLLARWRRHAGLFQHSRFAPEDEKSAFELPPTSGPVSHNGR